LLFRTASGTKTFAITIRQPANESESHGFRPIS
jgi:hypothetical protein